MLSRIQLFATPGTVAHEAPLSMGLFQQEYWSGLPFPPPGRLYDRNPIANERESEFTEQVAIHSVLLLFLLHGFQSSS